QQLLPRLVGLLEEAAVAGIPVTLDAEESDRLELQLALFAEARRLPALRRWGGLGLAVQAYQRRAPAVLAWLAEEAARHGGPIAVRLVKGAYWDGEIKRAQLLGLDHYPVWTRKAHTDLAWQACARRLLASPQAFWPQFATHNAWSLAWLETTAAATGADYEVQRLVGMGEPVHAAFRQHAGRALRLYAPVGAFTALLPYLVRRLLENGSSQSFVHQLANPGVPVATLLRDPLSCLGAAPSPHPALPAPPALFADRLNSPGLDLADLPALHQLRQRSAALPTRPLSAGPLLAAGSSGDAPRPCTAPSNPDIVLGRLRETTPEALTRAMADAARAQQDWGLLPVQARAERLVDWADALLEAREELIALLVHEAGKTLADASAEWREAFDFCHYYAAQALRLQREPLTLLAVSGEANQLTLAPRGVFLCISPWNFPLAIFVGQVAAALVTGNAVLAKPASQTPLVAWRAVQLALDAGLPAGVLQFVPASGARISATLLDHPALAGIAFTGSEAVAVALSRQLAAREGARLPLIAETGGLNALIADSSALPEQLVHDVLLSAFGSAGQRCSALRILFVQDDIRATVLAQLQGALACWRVDDPARLDTDTGPVIDATAQQALSAVIEDWQARARWMASADAPPGPGHFVAPHAFWLDREHLPQDEVFGPLLAISSFRADELPAVVEWINARGYGLTLGVHSRLDSTLAFVRRHARVGNLYENRHQTGAVVGCQPFGGEGRSGTGFKAGGPHYLLRFVTERTLTQNLSALGINTSLLDLDAD
ncbi:MAG: bifunctional proline dehydrogenase/L-glutamate gamma-semialdehyde dehydrogenase PutA, partial [Moraxellaceae bacterium]